MNLPAQRPLSPKHRAAWRKATDELLIDAIFGSAFKTIRDGDPVRAMGNFRRAPCETFMTPADLASTAADLARSGV